MTRFNLFVGGPQAELPADWPNLPGKWAGVDRGTLHLLQRGIQPQFAVGDFDSLAEAEHEAVIKAVANIHPAPAEKDETDTEMAVRLAFSTYGATEVWLIAATGGRIDHLLANLFLPTQPRFQPFTEHIHVLDQQNLISFYRAGQHQLLPEPEYTYLGIVPLTAIDGLTITGAKYPLHDWSSQTPFAWASNEFVGAAPVEVNWQSGIVAVIYSRDRVGQKRDN